MTDARLTPDPKLVKTALPARVCRPVVDLCRRPDGPRDRQLLLGAAVIKLNEADGWAYVQAVKDNYCGYVSTAALTETDSVPTHRVSVPATHAYTSANLKSPDLLSLSYGSEVTVTATEGSFATTPHGFIPLTHLAPADHRHDDPAAVAALFLGTPYLWGGNSRWGIDCSGLVQAALLACGAPCPGDSDQQETSLGTAVTGPYRRNDLLFWKGHVALVSDDNTMIHANAHAMAVTYETINDAISRIEKAGDGPVTSHRRL
tara:strand:+ start:97483 stop:98262 length:780 start_codon:yes stop_codon:yes gene_type:complete